MIDDISSVEKQYNCVLMPYVELSAGIVCRQFFFCSTNPAERGVFAVRKSSRGIPPARLRSFFNASMKIQLVL